MHIPFNKADFKTVAKTLKKELSSSGFNLELSHGATLNLLAKSFGYSDYNTFCGLNDDENTGLVQPVKNRDKYLNAIENILILDGMDTGEVLECIAYIENTQFPLFSKAFFVSMNDNDTVYSTKRIFFIEAINTLYFAYLDSYFRSVVGHLVVKEMERESGNLDYFDIRIETLDDGELTTMISLLESSNFFDNRFLNLFSKITNISSKYVYEGLQFANKIYTREVVIDSSMPDLSLLTQIKREAQILKNESYAEVLLEELNLFNGDSSMEFLKQNKMRLIDRKSGEKYSINIFDLFTNDFTNKKIYHIVFGTIADFLIEV